MATSTPTPPPPVTSPSPGVQSYTGNAATGPTIQTLSGPSATAPAPSSLAGAVWPTLPSNLQNVTFPMQTPGTAGEKKGAGKGAMDPNLTRIGDLVRILDGAHSEDWSQVNQGTLTDVLKTAGLTMPASAFSAPGDPFPAAQRDADLTSLINASWKMLMKKLPQEGIATNPAWRNAPTWQDIPQALQKIGTLSINPHSIAHLQYQGRNTAGLHTVADLVKQNDKLAQGAPGAATNLPGKPGTPSTQDGKSYYTQMMNTYHLGGVGAQNLITNLNALGMLDITDAVPTGQSVGAGVQKLMAQASQANMSPGEYSSQAISGTLPKALQQGLPNRFESADRAYVDHVADTVGVPISEEARVSIANAMTTMATGVDTEDWVAQQVAAAATQHIQQTPTLDLSSYNGMSLGIAESVRQAYAAQGVALDPTSLNKAVAMTLASGPTTVYQANEIAQSVGSEKAREAAASMYTSLAPQINQDTSVASLAAPYLQTAEKTLGMSAAEMNITNPQWMKWAEGGPDGKQLMSQTEWAHTLMTDPQYGFANSQTNKNLNAAGSLNILSSLGLMPQGEADFSNSSTAGLTTSTGA